MEPSLCPVYAPAPPQVTPRPEQAGESPRPLPLPPPPSPQVSPTDPGQAAEGAALTKHPPAALAQDAGQVLLALGALVPASGGQSPSPGRPAWPWLGTGTEREAGSGLAHLFLPGAPRPPEDGPIVEPQLLLFRLRLLASKPLQYPGSLSHRADRAGRSPITPQAVFARPLSRLSPGEVMRPCFFFSASSISTPGATSAHIGGPSAQGDPVTRFGGSAPRPAAQGRDSRRMRGGCRHGDAGRGGRGAVCLSPAAARVPGPGLAFSIALFQPWVFQNLTKSCFCLLRLSVLFYKVEVKCFTSQILYNSDKSLAVFVQYVYLLLL